MGFSKIRTKLLAVLTIALAGAMLFGSSASALSGSSFNASRIIDDSTFFAQHMNTGDIQNFLNAKVPTCDTNGTQASGHSGYATRADWGRANGAPPPYTCVKDYSQGFDSKGADAYCGAISGGTKSAANIIFDVAEACGVSPQTLLVQLQKEQALITDDWPWPNQYRSAMGYGCPDSAACDSQYYGFFNQVYNAARQFKRYVQQPQNYNHAAGRTSFVQYNPNSGCGGSNLTLQNQATAALYNYTPYQPNGAALANLYGSGDSCSAYGNRNFWRYYNDWFGPTSGNGFARVKSEDPNDLRQWVLYGSIKQHIPDSQTINAWGLGSTPLITMSANYLNSVATGPDLDRLMRSNTDGSVLYFLDNGKRYAVSSAKMLNTWGIGGMVTSYVSRDLFDLPSDGGYLSYDVKGPGSSTIYMTDGVSGGQRVLRPYQNDATFRAWEGDTAYYTDLSSDFFNTMNNAVGGTLTSTHASYGSSEYQVVNGKRLAQPSLYSSLYPGSAQAISAVTYDRLADGGQVSHVFRADGDPTVYLIDNGQKHAVASPTVLQAWGVPGNGVSLVNTNYIGLIPTGTALSDYTASNSGTLYLMNGAKIIIPANVATAYQAALPPYAASSALLGLYAAQNSSITGFVQSVGSPEVYLLDNSGNKRHIGSPNMATLLGAYAAGITQLHPNLINAIPDAADANNYVGDGTNEYLLENGAKHSVSGSVKADWGLGSPQVYSDGTLARFGSGTAITSKLRDGNSYFLIKGGRAFVTTDINIAQAWGIADAQQLNQGLITTRLYYYMLTRFVRPTDSSDTRTFVVDNGQWYNLSGAQFSNLGGAGAPVMGLNADSAPNTITDWTSIIVKTAANTYYVIDGGNKRYFPQQMIQDQWTNFGAVTVPTVTNGFVNLLDTRGFVERTIKGGSPAVYTVWGATKRHILYSSTYNQYYAPFGNVSDALINVLPTGSDI
jgi:hypothetical protein